MAAEILEHVEIATSPTNAISAVSTGPSARAGAAMASISIFIEYWMPTELDALAMTTAVSRRNPRGRAAR
jgi:hypothetical protein